MQYKNSITNASDGYRRGVIFGLTMAEVLLLLVFCILLFLAIINEKLEEKISDIDSLNSKLQDEITKNQSLTNKNFVLSQQLQILTEKIPMIPAGETITQFSEKMFQTAVVLEAANPRKALEILSALNKNPILFRDIQLSTIDEWAELTTIAQYSVTKEEFTALSQLNPQEKSNLFGNVEVASQISPIELESIILRSESVGGVNKNFGKFDSKARNNWPPIISLSEAKDYSFSVGSSYLTPKFKQALSGSISDQIYEILKEYNGDVIEVIGHTDPQPMKKNGTTNLDDFSVEFFKSEKTIYLNATDNAGLGYARALSVTKELMKVPKLSSYSILPYSAGQMITPDEQLQNGFDSYERSQLRRIEIRVRRKQ